MRDGGALFVSAEEVRGHRDLFTRFDGIVAECGIEKLKTMGDAYMAVAGAPVPREDHAEAAIDAALRMLDVAASWREAHGLELELRIGIAIGQAVGVIGEQRLLFDLWGDMVNMAARMQTTGIRGRIQVSEATMRRTHRPVRLTVVAWILIRTWSSAGTGRGTSSRRSTSGGPYRSCTTARIESRLRLYPTEL